MILRFGPRAHHSEVAWAVWISIVFGLSIDSAAVAVLDASDNAVVALLGLDAMQRGLLTSAPTANLWSQAVTPDGLIGSQWLLSYEAKIKGWLGSSGMPDHLAAVDYFSRMRALGIYFYDSAAALAFDPAGTRYRPSPFYGS